MLTRVVFFLLVLFLSASSQAQNLARVEAINWPPPNFELCLGESLIPEAVFRNLSDKTHDVQLLFTIKNDATGITVYRDSMTFQRLPAGESSTHTFRTFVSNENILSQLGRFRATASIAIVDDQRIVIPESDSLDNSMSINLFGIRRKAQPFNDASNNYTVLKPEFGGLSPDQHKWISIGVEVAEGDLVTFDPPSPNDYDGKGFGPLGLVSPVLKLDRKNAQGVSYAGNGVGDTLLSFPINLGRITWEMLTLDFHRSDRRQYGLDHDRMKLHGPEATIIDQGGNVTRVGDSLIVEFRHPADSACGDAAARWVKVAGLDGGKDFEWQRIAIELDSAILGHNFFTSNFRMRFRLNAKADQLKDVIDDDDNWHLDNLQLRYWHHPEVTINWVRVVTPYTKVPASQAIFPIYAKLSGVGPRWWGELPVYVHITDASGRLVYTGLDSARFPGEGMDTIIRFPDWDARSVDLSNGSQFIVRASTEEWFDSYSDDNDAFTRITLNLGQGAEGIQEFALDDGTNDIPELVQRQGAGVGFDNTSGSYALRFKLTEPDTLFGARIFFGIMNSSLDAIRITVHRGSDSTDVPGEIVDGAMLETMRNIDGSSTFKGYHFHSPVYVPAGHYWLSVSQLSLDNMMIGADASRSGYDLTVSGPSPEYKFIHDGPYGTNHALNENSGDISGAVAFEIPAGSGKWRPLTPETSKDTLQGFFGWTGTYLPMIRLLVGSKKPPLDVSAPPHKSQVAVYPNPFAPGTETLTIEMAEQAGPAWIANVLGQPIRRINSSGLHLHWDGSDAYGNQVTPGVYFIISGDVRAPLIVR